MPTARHEDTVSLIDTVLNADTAHADVPHFRVSTRFGRAYFLQLIRVLPAGLDRRLPLMSDTWHGMILADDDILGFI